MKTSKLLRAGQVTLPQEVREALNLVAGDEVQWEVREGWLIGVPLKKIPAKQAWFWTKEWQAGEREADDDFRRGNVDQVQNAEGLDELLDEWKKEN